MHKKIIGLADGLVSLLLGIDKECKHKIKIKVKISITYGELTLVTHHS